MKTQNSYVNKKMIRKGKVFLVIMAALLVCALCFTGCGAKAMSGEGPHVSQAAEAGKKVAPVPGEGVKAVPAVQKHEKVQQAVVSGKAPQRICTNPYCDDWDCDDIVCDETYADMIEEQREDQLEALGYDD